jgi:hypothetical protein
VLGLFTAGRFEVEDGKWAASGLESRQLIDGPGFRRAGRWHRAGALRIGRKNA